MSLASAVADLATRVAAELKALRARDIPAAAKAATLPRWACNTVAPLTAGSLRLTLVHLTAGTVVSNIVVPAASTAGATLTHCRVGLYSASQTAPVLLGEAPDDTTAAWAANTARTFALAAPYTVPTTGFYYVGMVITGTTLPTFYVNNAAAGTGLNALPPVASGNANTGLSGAASLPNPAAAPVVVAATMYAQVA